MVWNGKILTLDDLVNNSIGAFLIDIIDDDVGSKFCIHVSVGTSNSSASASDDHGLPIEAYSGG